MRKKNVIRPYKKLLSKSDDRSYTFLLALEKTMLQRMKESHADFPLFHDDNARYIGLCIRLIDVILEDDSLARIARLIPRQEVKKALPYINTRNERRFITDYDRVHPPYERMQPKDRKQLKMKLRRLKALHLYSLIREYQMFNWW